MPSTKRLEERDDELITRFFRRTDALKREARSRFTAGSRASAVRIRRYLQLRFKRLARPGGPWRNLRPGTIEGKRRIGSPTPEQKLRRYGTLYRSLEPEYRGLPGQYEVETADGIDIGIGGAATYPSGIKIGDVARIHQDGLGRMPKRPIIVRPPGDVIREVTDDITTELLRESV